ncbi:TPA: type II toxin-antitoxin system RelE/ParE family toxin [Campylobacter fetus]|nr:type II toxin-antitoxin system RelE/ParE family toxin [Campylobacter fetus]
MQTIIFDKKVEKYLNKQAKGDPKGIYEVNVFIKEILAKSDNPTMLKNAEKLQGHWKNLGNFWRWKVHNYRILAEVKSDCLIIHIIKIAQRENFYQ